MGDFSPYTDNGGTVVAIGGKDYAIIASETRLSTGYQVYTREQPKLFKITDSTILGITGCWCDALAFAKAIEGRAKTYLYDHNRTISTTACAQLISTMLYYKRFFPYYITNILVGLNENGKGVVYDYDPVGCFSENSYYVGGSSASMIQPFLDNRLGLKNIGKPVPDAEAQISLDDAVKLVKDVFVSAAERDIYVGDHVEIRVVTANGILSERYNLRKD